MNRRLKIGSVDHNNRSALWCGPAAVSAVTHLSTRDVTDEFRNERRLIEGDGTYRIAGVTNDEIVRVLMTLDVMPVVISDHVMEPLPPTLAKWMKLIPESERVDPILIRQTSHFLVIQGRRFVDNNNPVPTFLKYAPRRARVLSAWRLVSADGLQRGQYGPHDGVPGLVSKAAATHANV